MLQFSQSESWFELEMAQIAFRLKHFSDITTLLDKLL